MGLNERFRKEWKASGYARGNGSDAVVPPPPKGLKRLYYLTGSNHAVSNIVFGRIKVSRISELNDPFELLGTVFSDQHTNDIIREYKAAYNNNNGLICFSEDWTDPVLWSHYADKHCGVALGFDVADSITKQVTYSTLRLKPSDIKKTGTISPSIAEKLVLTKFKSWCYEREWRVIATLEACEKEGTLYFLPLNGTLKLTEVILGPLCTLSLTKVRRMVDKHHEAVASFKARLAFKSFRLFRDGKTVKTIPE